MNFLFSTNHATVTDILQHLTSCASSFYPPLNETVDIPQYAQKLVDRAVRFEVWSGTDLAGLVAMYCTDSTLESAFISNVSVETCYTGQGIAQRLLSTSIDHATKLGFSQISLKVSPINQTANHIYTSLGFRAEGSPMSDQTLLALALPTSPDARTFGQV